MLASQRWKAMIEEEHAQSERMRGAVPPPEDHWRPYAQQFKADPRRAGDPLVNRLLHEIAPHNTVIDVGAGGGRLALPLALRCRHVTAVEPSASMVAVLRQQISNYSIQNVSVVEAAWGDAEVEAADIVLCAHVMYIVRDVEHFVRKLEAHARERVLVVLYEAPPQSQLYPLWKRIHGEERIPLPGLSEYRDVLSQLGISPHVETLSQRLPRGYDNHQQALELLSRRLYLTPGSRQTAMLEAMLPELLEEVDGTFYIRGAPPQAPGLVWWRPEA